ncbi:DUF2911 domain-containing protein [Chondrinema litorale]|uniref:DUF2911 domain-containing protein n=1 Tax=Chondrinema litorale TaxID=2994555 RepID=UPI0025437CD9|nr:DUF2911 domain-containing protein [Chondrinema litorale]UZR93342.1 DUF2911 domain-containing protein [Chondrinema litorale]
MRKKILLAIAVLVIGFAGYIAYLLLNTRSHSPAETAEHNEDGLNINVSYCRPYKKERVIFGTEEDGALQPYGAYWRTGANEPTKITFGESVIFNGEKIDAGTYSFYTVPGQKEWTVALNSAIAKWGYSEPDYSKEIHRSKVLADKPESPVEQFTITFEPQGNHVNMVLAWDNAIVKIPVSPTS